MTFDLFSRKLEEQLLQDGGGTVYIDFGFLSDARMHYFWSVCFRVGDRSRETD